MKSRWETSGLCHDEAPGRHVWDAIVYSTPRTIVTPTVQANVRHTVARQVMSLRPADDSSASGIALGSGRWAVGGGRWNR